MATVLITGGSGFIGSYVIRELLDRNHRIVVFDLTVPTGQMAWLLGDRVKAVTWVRGGVTDLPGLLNVMQKHGVERVFHAAALYDPVYSIDQPSLTYEVNVQGTINVLEAARVLGVGRIVQSSSIAVYAPKRYEPMDEWHPMNTPLGGNAMGPYGASKAAAELIGLTYGETLGTDFLALRYSGVYGFGMRFPMYIKPFVENSVDGQPTEFPTGGDMPRDYTHIRDVAQAVVRGLEVDAAALTQRAFNIASGQVHTAAEAAAFARDIVPGARIAIGPGLTEFEQSDIKLRGQLSIDAARAQLGYEPKFPLREGMAEYAETYRRWRADTA